MTHHFYHAAAAARRRTVLAAVSRLALRGRLTEEIAGLPESLTAAAEFADEPTAGIISGQPIVCSDLFSMEAGGAAGLVGNIRSALGLSPQDKTEDNLTAAAAAALSQAKVTEPIIAVNAAACDGCAGAEKQCLAVCQVDALTDNNGTVAIDDERCLRCGLCVPACPRGAITDKAANLPVINLLQSGIPVFALIAPAFAGQFGVRQEQVKAGLLSLGFAGVVEVALAADVITISEADEFISRTDNGAGFMITSCCCPSFLKLVEKYRSQLAYLISPSVSPMIAMGRLVKAREREHGRNVRTVFIGPCIAKKSEALLPELSDAIDAVLTFQETAALFAAADIRLAELAAAEPLQDASHDGRSYGHTGGVSAAIARSLRTLGHRGPIRTAQGDGIAECKRLLDQAESGILDANFIEGMACPGGCVGGPGKLVETNVGAAGVDDFADVSPSREAAANRIALELARRYRNRLHLVSAHHGAFGGLGLGSDPVRVRRRPEAQK